MDILGLGIMIGMFVGGLFAYIVIK